VSAPSPLLRSAWPIVGWCLFLGGLVAGLLYLPFAPAQACPDRPAADCYFPKSPDDGEQVLSDFERSWYAQHLDAMREPPIGQLDGDTWRFLWLRTFHHPVSVRIEAVQGQLRLTAIELDGAGGYAPGNVRRRIESILGQEDASTFRRSLEAAEIWSVPVAIDVNGLDGAEWVFEFRQSDRYRIVHRWSPDAHPMRELGLAFLRATGWDYPEHDIY